jgi:hypothetical protein
MELERLALQGPKIAINQTPLSIADLRSASID